MTSQWNVLNEVTNESEEATVKLIEVKFNLPALSYHYYSFYTVGVTYSQSLVHFISMKVWTLTLAPDSNTFVSGRFFV